jgi:hypothetical protein
MPIIEKLGSFYLGREYDLATRTRRDAAINYDARDLVTHAVCVGMTGSGKTGLCIDLLEEAAIDQVPAIIIDPKGDIANLLLKFPALRPGDFEPWVNVDDARRKGMSLQEYASSVAATWAKGLADWEQGPERVLLAKESAEVRVFTPGSDAGIPVSILASLAAPRLSWDDDGEAIREQIQGTVSALLGLVDVQTDPLQSREHILLSTIVEHYWRQGRDLDLPTLIKAVQSPPVRQLGVFDVDTFFPEKDRFGLALRLNSIIASPGFAAWLSGEPLDVEQLLHDHGGRPRHSIFYLAHLSEPERMFFVTLLLEQVVSWVRRQSGTTSLRALLYFDEVFGYFPPVSMPPSKRPLMTLLKQARASGLGVLLCTQNPVDLDYKGLSNAGTWFVGKLQTDRDKARMLDGLESVSAEGGTATDRGELERIIAGLDSRIFLLHNVHSGLPVVFETRWAMSYLRGPLTRSQLRALAPPKTPSEPSVPVATGTPAAPPSVAPVAPFPLAASRDTPPVLPADVPVVFLPIRVGSSTARQKAGAAPVAGAPALAYEPALAVLSQVGFHDPRRGVSLLRRDGMLVPPESLTPVARWDEAEAFDIAPADLAASGEPGARFSDLPRELSTAASLRGFGRTAADHLYRQARLEIWHCPALDLFGAPGEAEGAFRVRVQHAAHERRDDEVQAMRRSLDDRRDRLEAQLERERRELERDRERHSARQREELLSAGESVVRMLGLFGRRRSASISKAATKRRMTSSAGAEVEESEMEITRLREEIDELRATIERNAGEVAQRWERTASDIKAHVITPRRSDVTVELVAVAWVPYWEFGAPGTTLQRVPAWR